MHACVHACTSASVRACMFMCVCFMTLVQELGRQAAAMRYQENKIMGVVKGVCGPIFGKFIAQVLRPFDSKTEDVCEPGEKDFHV